MKEVVRQALFVSRQDNDPEYKMKERSQLPDSSELIYVFTKSTKAKQTVC